MAIDQRVRMPVYIFCINFNTEAEIISLLKSIRPVGSLSISVIIVDNSDTFDCQYLSVLNIDSINIEVLKPGENLGYFGGVRFGLDEAAIDLGAGYLMIANPDLIFGADFFERLSTLELAADVGVVAPKITNRPSGDEANPFLRRRPSRQWMQFRRFVHRYPLVLFFYDLLSNMKQRWRARFNGPQLNASNCEQIYAAHGSLFIMSSSYITKGCDFDHKGFLFGEELYVAEMCFEKNLRTIYCSSLEVTHYQHASISKLRTKQFAGYAFESLTFLKGRFFG